MKIDGNRPNLDQAALQRLEKAATEAAKPAAPAKTGSGDRVALSADAELANQAVRAANGAPEVRKDLVTKMKAAIAAGELGSDAGALADSLIDSIVEQK